jgi:hypothetical protein
MGLEPRLEGPWHRDPERSLDEAAAGGRLGGAGVWQAEECGGAQLWGGGSGR